MGAVFAFHFLLNDMGFPESGLQTPFRVLVEFRASENPLRMSERLCYSNFESLTMPQFGSASPLRCLTHRYG